MLALIRWSHPCSARASYSSYIGTHVQTRLLRWCQLLTCAVDRTIGSSLSMPQARLDVLWMSTSSVPLQHRTTVSAVPYQVGYSCQIMLVVVVVCKLSPFERFDRL